MAKQEQFKIVPSQEDLDSIKRELRFYPIKTQRPIVLKQQEITAYNQDGFIKRFRILSEKEVGEYQNYFDGLQTKVTEAGGDWCSINTAHLEYGKVYDLLKHPKIIALVKDLLGENIIGWESHYFCKLPDDTKTIPLHRDVIYWPITPSKTVNVFLALDDMDTQNACMHFLPGSHLDKPKTFLSNQKAINKEKILTNSNKKIVNGELKAGEISIHSGLVLHGSGANHSNRRRARLTLRYCTPDVQAYLGWKTKGVIVSGEDLTGQWANPPRPERD